MSSTTYALVLRLPLEGGRHPGHLGLTADCQPLYRAVPDMVLSEKHRNEAGALEKYN